MRAPPGGTISHHSVEDREQLPHARYQRNLLGLASGQEALVERSDDGVVAAGYQRPHVERLPDPRPATPHAPATSQSARIPVERSNAHQSREFSGRKRAKLGKLSQQRSAQDRSDSRNAPKQGFVLLEGGTALNGLIEVPIGTRELLLQPADVCFDALSNGLGASSAEAVFLGRHHLDELSSASEDGLKLPRFGIRKRPGSRTYGLGEAGKDLGVEPIGFGEPTRGTGEVSGLSGIEHGYGDPSGASSESRGDRTLKTTAGFEDHEDGVQLFELAEEFVESILIIGHSEGLSRGEEGHLQAGFGDVYTDVVVGASSWWGIQLLLAPYLPADGPNLAGAGSKASCAPAQATVRAPPEV